MPPDSLQLAYHAACDRWRMCDWHTKFGPLELDLFELRAAHAERISRATSGEESKAWQLAADWLRTVENRSLEAQIAGANALSAHLRGDRTAAIASAVLACELEAEYHTTLVWSPFRQALERTNSSTQLDA